jgi:predicted dinucleotide-binding enzyme
MRAPSPKRPARLRAVGECYSGYREPCCTWRKPAKPISTARSFWTSQMPWISSSGFPPSLTVCNTDSIAETIQRTYPEVRVVKSLNTVSAPVMVDPGMLPGAHDIFMAGNDEAAKATVSGLLQEFGWAPHHIRDLGGLDAARGLEMWLPLWLRIFMQQPHGKMFNIGIVSE